jgi:2-C-methyl-D-erythritol 4-phosphate cytidylyltransferase
MGASIPKQYLELCGRPIVAWSLRLFAAMAEVRDVVVVCEPEYRDLISKHWGEACERAAAEDPAASVPELKWAPPGAERQDSVRPLTAAADVRRCLSDASDCGAAVLGVPVKPTIKEVNDDGTVARTLVRARLWEVQTPQVIEPALLRRGFAFATERNLEVTDDVSVVELLGETVRITQGSYTNIKVRI